MQLNTEQQAVLTSLGENLAVEAVAGSGKTTVIRHAIKKLGFMQNMLYLVFNKKNQVEASEKLPKYCDVKTFNSFGNSLCYNIGLKGRINKDKIRNIYRFDVHDYSKASKTDRKRINSYTGKIVTLIRLVKGYGHMNLAEANLEEISFKHDIDLPSDERFFADLNATWTRGLDSHVRDFDDQLFLPIKHEAEFPKYDYVFVDEAQDLNPIKIEMIRRLATITVIVGDRHQAIYGFAGADLDAFDNLKGHLAAKELPLSYCYRCASSIIEEAQSIVPQIKAAPNAIEGKVSWGPNDAEPDDFVICRTTAPLVTECLDFIRQGKHAVVLGSEIGANLLGLAGEIGITHAKDLETAANQLNTYRERRIDKLSKLDRPDIIENLLDRCLTLSVLLERCDSPSDLHRVIEAIFSSQQAGVTFMTAHKSKGLEARKVYILRPDLLPHPAIKGPLAAQEDNLKYVAVTRAMEELVYVE